MPIYLVNSKKKCIFAAQFGVLAHLVERNTGSVEVSGSSPLYSTKTDNCLIVRYLLSFVVWQNLVN